MVIRIINALLMLVAVAMGFKQGFAMATAKPEMVTMFSKWNFDKVGLMINGVVTIIAAAMIIFPKTFIWGNFLMSAGILLIICFHLADGDFKGVLIELPFLFLNLVIIYLQHPMARN
ncbi:hypothetical protein DSL64_25770 [Dyadobacter luteus]|jgi:hypothetical protein|uniref:DoxX family protein n=1 Tax=Dyadobacter luteus TaxID=2259619 RepID=A0A3D8Y3T8_9BACT|nr:DoxX family protein [Dyadobacter luteus]REA56775.1 hypothetical protein DSL64_25770 [Dyadobacter luteus]